MVDLIERLRAANPVPELPPPPIEAVWKKVETSESLRTQRHRTGGLRITSIAWRPSPGGMMTAIASAAVVAVVIGVVAVFGRERTNTTTRSHTPSSPLTRATAPSHTRATHVPTSLHAQADRLLGPTPGLDATVHSLRGIPIVINIWASWCEPCRGQFGRFASAAHRYGHDIAFLGADLNDTARAARSFLTQHRLGYPSYQTTAKQIRSIVPPGVAGLPTTIFVNRSGKVVDVHLGEYESLAALEHDIATR
jgi:cytochrome c biogenesis protein CcmG, thiol:disulfide interchange protein DsbE